MDKKLFKSASDKKIAGVCGGCAKYFDIDPTVMRLIWTALILFGGLSVWVYIVAWIIMPEGE